MFLLPNNPYNVCFNSQIEQTNLTKCYLKNKSAIGSLSHAKPGTSGV